MNYSVTRKLKRTGVLSKNKPVKSEDKLVHYLKRNENNTSKAHLKEVPESKIASLDYKIIKELNNYFALEISHTGRHHQIRAQLSAMVLL
jgi:23S rRNA pseudouridine1911/1915/1917 synthase